MIMLTNICIILFSYCIIRKDSNFLLERISVID